MSEGQIGQHSCSVGLRHRDLLAQGASALRAFPLQQVPASGARAQDFAGCGDFEPLRHGFSRFNCSGTSHRDRPFVALDRGTNLSSWQSRRKQLLQTTNSADWVEPEADSQSTAGRCLLWHIPMLVNKLDIPSSSPCRGNAADPNAGLPSGCWLLSGWARVWPLARGGEVYISGCGRRAGRVAPVAQLSCFTGPLLPELGALRLFGRRRVVDASGPLDLLRLSRILGSLDSSSKHFGIEWARRSWNAERACLGVYFNLVLVGCFEYCAHPRIVARCILQQVDLFLLVRCLLDCRESRVNC